MVKIQIDQHLKTNMIITNLETDYMVLKGRHTTNGVASTMKLI